MIAVLALLVSIATVTLLAFGERLGLAAGLTGLLIPAILGLFILTIALVSATSRLAVYLDASDSPSALRPAAVQLALVLAGLALLPNLSMAEPRTGIALLLAYVVTLILVPPRRPTSLLPEAERRMGGSERSLMLGLVTIGFSGILFGLWFEPARTWLAAAISVRGEMIQTLMIAGLALVVLLGGLSALSRLAEGALAFTLVFAGLPLLVALGLDAFRVPDFVGALDTTAPLARFRASVSGLALNPDTLKAILIGIGLGLISLASTPALGSPLRRGGFGLLVGAMATLIAVGFAHEAGLLPALVMRDLIPTPPQNWPLFVFEESIRGWLIVCQQAPRDAIDVIQACRRSGITGAIPPEMFEIRPDMIGPALAASRGVPATFGLVSGLLGPFFVFVALALVLHVAASGFAETVIYRLLSRQSLRAARLVRARVAVIVILAPFAILSAVPVFSNSRIALWLMLSLALVLAVTLIADWMLALLRQAQKWRHESAAREESDLTSEQSV